MQLVSPSVIPILYTSIIEATVDWIKSPEGIRRWKIAYITGTIKIMVELCLHWFDRKLSSYYILVSQFDYSVCLELANLPYGYLSRPYRSILYFGVVDKFINSQPRYSKEAMNRVFWIRIVSSFRSQQIKYRTIENTQSKGLIS